MCIRGILTRCTGYLCFGRCDVSDGERDCGQPRPYRQQKHSRSVLLLYVTYYALKQPINSKLYSSKSLGVCAPVVVG